MVMRHQPQGLLRIDRTNPITKGLVFAAVPGGAELVSGVFPTRIGGAYTGVNEWGRSLSTISNSTDGWHWLLPPTHPLYSITTEDSIFVLARRTGTGSAIFGTPHKTATWAAPFYAWGLVGSNAATYHFAITGQTARRVVNSTVGFFVNDEIHGYGTSRKLESVKFIKDGAQHSAGTVSALGQQPVDWGEKPGPTLFTRSAVSPGEGTIGQSGLVLVWNRELSPNEWRLVNDNPWQVLEDASDTFEYNNVSSISYIDSSGRSFGQSAAAIAIRSIWKTNCTTQGNAGTNTVSYSVSTSSGQSTTTAQVHGNAACVWLVSGAGGGSAEVLAIIESVSSFTFIDSDAMSYGSSFTTTESNVLSDAIAHALAAAVANLHVAGIITTTGLAVSSSLSDVKTNKITEASCKAVAQSSSDAICIVIHNAVAASLSVSDVQAAVQTVSSSFAQVEGTSSVSGTTQGGVHYTAVGDKFSVTITFSPYAVTVEDRPYKISINQE